MMRRDTKKRLKSIKKRNRAYSESNPYNYNSKWYCLFKIFKC